MKKSCSLLLLLTALFLLPCCHLERDYDPELAAVLKKAEANEPALQKVINHYRYEAADDLKLKAAIFLIKEMPGKGYQQYVLEDSNLNNVDVNLFQYRMKDSIRKMKLYLEQLRGRKIVYSNAGFSYDLEHISAATLIDNIDAAFEAWKQPWAKHLSFGQFCEFILPYRTAEEPLQDWRKKFQAHTGWITDSCRDKNVLETTAFINDSVKRGYSYKHNGLFFFPGCLNLKQLNDLTGGRCEDLNMITCYWLRAAGIPVASEFTPFWGNSNFGGHAWLSVLDTDGKFVPMTSAYDNPKRDSLPFENRLSKAYRIMYAVQPTSLAAITNGKETLPRFLMDKHLIDITDQYIPTKDITVKMEQIESSDHYAYLGLLNGPDWEIIAWGNINAARNAATFPKVGLGVIYIPMLVRKNAYRFAGPPFLLNAKGEMEPLGNSHRLGTLTFNVIDGAVWMRPSGRYHLTYWEDNTWKESGISQTFTGNPQEFKKLKQPTYIHYNKVPENTLLRLVYDSILSRNDYGRPVVLNNGSYHVY